MTEAMPLSGVHSSVSDEAQPHYPKHRREDVPIDAEPDRDALLGEFGENPNTAVAG